MRRCEIIGATATMAGWHCTLSGTFGGVVNSTVRRKSDCSRGVIQTAMCSSGVCPSLARFAPRSSATSHRGGHGQSERDGLLHMPQANGIRVLHRRPGHSGRLPPGNAGSYLLVSSSRFSGHPAPASTHFPCPPDERTQLVLATGTQPVCRCRWSRRSDL